MALTEKQNAEEHALSWFWQTLSFPAEFDYRCRHASVCGNQGISRLRREALFQLHRWDLEHGGGGQQCYPHRIG